MANIDYNNAISIPRDTYWIGFYDEEAEFTHGLCPPCAKDFMDNIKPGK